MDNTKYFYYVASGSDSKVVAKADKKFEAMFEKAKRIKDFNLIYENVPDDVRRDSMVIEFIKPSARIRHVRFIKNLNSSFIFDIVIVREGSGKGYNSIAIQMINDSGEFKVSARYTGYAYDTEFVKIINELNIEQYFLEYVSEYINLVKSSKVASNKVDILGRFKELYYDTGRTLTEVMQLMAKEGYPRPDIVNAVLTVLGPVKWDS